MPELKKKQVLIVGAGWYGLHTALYLKTRGYHVTVVEKGDEILFGAGRWNQLRLHQGFHYLRSMRTRKQAQEGFLRFISEYPDFSVAVESNLYAVPTEESNLDFGTISSILNAENFQFSEVPQSELTFFKRETIEGAWTCQERLVLPHVAREFFSTNLRDDLVLNQEIIWQGDYESTFQHLLGEFDFFIDATYGSLYQFPEAIHEATLLGGFRAEGLPFGALTLVDGALFSIFPTAEDGLYSFSHVTHSVLGQFESRDALSAFMSEGQSALVGERLRKMIEHLEKFLPNLVSEGLVLEPLFIQHKMKPKGRSDNRHVIFKPDGRFSSILGGKIDAVFEGVRGVERWLEI